ncbi:MAG TPA: hypothetical protein PLV15_05290, partial [Smithella sp.]|nr:hypothetical protein [Smithella sp.]
MNNPDFRYNIAAYVINGIKSFSKRGFMPQRGSVLISIIVGTVIIGILGVGIISFTTTSTYGELFANRQVRAYYMAEAGGQYAIKLLNENKSNTSYLPPNGTYKLGPNGSDGEFSLTSTSDNTDPDMPRVKVVSVGVVHKGTWLESKKKITYKIPRANPTAGLDGTTDISFDGNNNDVLDPVWVPTVSQDGGTVEYDKISDAVLIKTKEALIALSPTAIDFITARTNSGGLLSYEVQVKINMNFKDDKADYIAMGLNFRLDKALKRSYGISFYRAITKENQMPAWFPERFKPSFTSTP